jgi:signal transduction histidine kinase
VLLEQLVANLVDNAIKYNNGGAVRATPRPTAVSS